MNIHKSEYQELLSDLVSLIEKTKLNVISYANSSLTILFWHVGNRVLTQTLQHKRADYGKQIVVTLSRELVEKAIVVLMDNGLIDRTMNNYFISDPFFRRYIENYA